MSRTPLLTLPLLAACSGAAADRLARPTIDTLPSGVVRVISQGPAEWRVPQEGWRFAETTRIHGVEGTESELINPRSLAVDSWGRVFVVDQGPEVIKVYAPDGTMVRTIGREGAGPGEFRVAFIAIRGAHLVVFDPSTARTSVFDTSGVFLRSWSSSCCYWTSIALDREGRITVPVLSEDKGGTPWVRYALDGTPLDTLLIPSSDDSRHWRVGDSQGRTMMMMSIPLTPRVTSGFDPDGGFVIGHSGSYQLAVTRTTRDTVQLFGRSWTPELVTPQQKADTIEAIIRRFLDGPSKVRVDEAAFRSSLRAEDIPDNRPAFEAISVDDDGNRWIRLGPAEGGVRYDIFAPDGAWRGEVVIPVSFGAYAGQSLSAERIVVATEEEDGRPVVVVLVREDG